MGTAIDFGLAIVDCLTDFDEEVAEHVKKGIVYRNFEEVYGTRGCAGIGAGG